MQSAAATSSSATPCILLLQLQLLLGLQTKTRVLRTRRSPSLRRVRVCPACAITCVSRPMHSSVPSCSACRLLLQRRSGLRRRAP